MYGFFNFFDLSNFPKDSKYYCADNKKVLGKLKDEYGGTPIKEYVGTKSKTYSIRDMNYCKNNAHKGHNYNIIYDDFEDVLFNEKVIRHSMGGMKSIDHKMYTYEINKKSLSAFDDKRYILADGINTLSNGYKDIPRNK